MRISFERVRRFSGPIMLRASRSPESRFRSPSNRLKSISVRVVLKVTALAMRESFTLSMKSPSRRTVPFTSSRETSFARPWTTTSDAICDARAELLSRFRLRLPLRSVTETSPSLQVISAVPSRPMMLMSPCRVDRTTEALRGIAISRSSLIQWSPPPRVLASRFTSWPLTVICGRVLWFQLSACSCLSALMRL